jgi:hypothetical protein
MDSLNIPDAVNVSATEDYTTGGVSLSQTYANEAEGFAFKYPGTWNITDISEFDLDDANISVLVAAPVESNFAANINVAVYKGDADESIFTASKSDFQEEFLLIFNEVDIIDLSDIELDGVPARKVVISSKNEDFSYAQTAYFYNVGNDMYTVTLTSLESSSDQYEPTFNAIMESYTITRTANEINFASDSPYDEWLIAYSDLLMAYKAYQDSGWWDYSSPLIADSFLVIPQSEWGMTPSTWNDSNAGAGFDINSVELCYALRDINEDGILELFIGTEEYYDYSRTTRYNIFGVYSLQGGKAVSVIQKESRGPLALLRDNNGNCVIQTGDGGSGHREDIFYTIDKAGSLIMLDRLTYREVYKDGTFMGMEYTRDIEGTEVEITEEEYSDRILKYGASEYEGEAREISLNWNRILAAEEGYYGADYDEYDEVPYEEEYQSSYIDANFEWIETPHAQTDNSSFINERYIAGKVRNRTNTTFSYVMIEFRLYDSSGNQITTTVDSISSLSGGNTWSFKAPVWEDAAASYEFVEITAF